MRFKKIVSLLCIASLIASQGSVAAVSYLSESEDTPTAETEMVENEKTKVYINGINSKQEENLKNYIKNNIKINSKTYDGTIIAEVDFSGVELKVKSNDLTDISVNDKLTLTATAEFEDKNAGENKTVTIKAFTLKKIETTDVNEDESTDVDQTETTDVNENESTDVDQTKKADDIKAEAYKLDIPENFTVETTADISKKEIPITPQTNTYNLYEVGAEKNVAYKDIKEYIVDGDELEKEPQLSVIFDDETQEYKYSLTNNDVGNYLFILGENAVPTVGEPSIKDIFVSLPDTAPKSAILNQDDKAVYSNSSVVFTVTAEFIKQPDNDIKFLLSDQDNQKISEVNVKKDDVKQDENIFRII